MKLVILTSHKRKDIIIFMYLLKIIPKQIL